MLRFAYWGHHKCASTWTTKILHTVAWRAGWKIGKHETWKGSDHRNLNLLSSSKDILISPNSRIQDSQAIPDVPGFHIVRDPRDLIVSAYYSHRNSHPTKGWPELLPQRQRLLKMEKTAGIIATMDFLPGTIQSMAEWDYEQAHIIEAQMEDITQRPYQALLDVFEALGVLHDPMNEKPLSSIANHAKAYLGRLESYPARWLLQDIHSHRYKKLSGGRAKGEVNENSHYRSGTPNDWLNHWNDRIQQAYEEHFQDAHRAMGYTLDF